MAEINLLKNELKDRGPFSFAPKSLTPLYFTLGLLVFEAVLYGGMFFYEKYLDRQKLGVDAEITAIESEISQSQKNVDEAQSVQARLANLGVLLDNHVFWSQVFDELEKYTYKPIVYNTLEADMVRGQFRISGITSNYTDLGKLLLGLESSPNITGVTLESTSQGQQEQSGYTFSLEIMFDPKLFLK